MSVVKSLEIAQAAKDRGNVAFKAGDFPVAIGHYTAAILADRDDHTLPLNRAAAYLKLGKNEDAERDCTTVLSLSASNVKALYRRGQARLALEKLYDAQGDLMEALKFEPANNAIREELKRVNSLLGKKTAQSRRPSVAPTPNATPKRRRVPITIIDPTTAGPSKSQTTSTAVKLSSKTASQILPSAKPATDILQPISSRQLKSQPVISPPSPSTTETIASGSPRSPISARTDESRTFKDAKQARENAKPSRVGGGIFRASGDSTIFPVREEMTTKPNSTAPLRPPLSTSVAAPASKYEAALPPSSTTLPKASVTLFDFSRIWRSTSAIEDRWALISTILPSNLPILFKSSLEPTLLVDILQMFETLVNDEKRKPLVREYMENFARVPRIGTVVLFLSRGEKELARRVWESLGVEENAVDPMWRTCF